MAVEYPLKKWVMMTGEIPWHVAEVDCRKRRDGRFSVRHPEGPIVVVPADDVYDTEALADQALMQLVVDLEE